MAKKDNKKGKSGLISKIIIWTMVGLMAFPAIAAILGAFM